MSRALRTAATLALIFALPGGSALAGTAGEGISKSITAVRTDSAPRIDGRLDDPVWKNAKPDARFTQNFPNDGARPTVRTVVRLLYDDRALYIGVQALDPHPDKIFARLARRDSTVESDHVAIVIGGRHDHDSGVWFWINAAGVVADGQIHDDTRVNRLWDAVWRGKAVVHDKGWSAELAIPYSILRFPNKAKQRWSFHIDRFVARKKEVLQWVHRPQGSAGYLSRAGHIIGIENLRPRRALELRPFIVLQGESILPTGGAFGVGEAASFDRGFSAGVDLKVGLTNNLTMDASLLPDFGQVEADSVVLNLSTFEVQFPEKRPFFLESSDLFNTDVRLFYSRRIGQRVSGLGVGSQVADEAGKTVEVTEAPLAVPIWAAARVTGKLNRRFTVAGLAALTGPESLQVRTPSGDPGTIEPSPARHFTAARGKYSLGGSSYLGFITTALNRFGQLDNARENHDAYTQGIDGRWVRSDGRYRAYFMLAASKRVGGGRFIDDDGSCTDSTCTRISRADGTLMNPGDPGIAAEMGGGKVAGGNWRIWGNYQMASPRFDVNDVGFENDWDYHKTYTDLTYRQNQPFSIFQNASVGLRLNTKLGFKGLRKDASLQLVADAQHRSFWYVSTGVGYRPPDTWTTRETSDGAQYERADWAWANLHMSSDSRRKLRGSLGASAGFSPAVKTWNAGVSGSLIVRVIAPLELSLQGSFNTTQRDLRFYGCTDIRGAGCSVLSSSRDYQFAELDSESMSFTLRTAWALSTELSLQVYTQVFAARGRYHDYADILGQTGARPFLARDERVASTFDGDSDGDGLKDDDFSFATVNGNVVMRWEITPGTTLIGVYTRSQVTNRALLGRRPTLSLRGLNRSSTAEVVLLKLTLYYD